MAQTAFVVGDQHFKEAYIEDCEAFIDACVAAVQDYSPDFIVLLGDILDKMNKVDVIPHNLACRLIEELSEISHVYLLIGNHDLINNSQFLTRNHIFGPLKKWDNVTVVDTVVCAEHGDRFFVFCPYVPPGRFVEALNTLDSDLPWECADCIFAHQEFHGCKMGAAVSEVGDMWCEDHPPVISGHIHDAQIVKNVYYPGSSIQHAYGDTAAKYVWFVTFDSSDDHGFVVEKIDLKVRGKKLICIDIEEIGKFNIEDAQKHNVKLRIRGTKEQIKLFKKSKLCTEIRKVVKTLDFAPVTSGADDPDGVAKSERRVRTHEEILRELVCNTKSSLIAKAYNQLGYTQVNL